MSDPFEVLRKESSAENPPPRFVLALCRRLEQEFNAATANTQPGTQPVTDSRTQVHTAAPCLVVPDLAAAIDFYVTAFGAVGVERHRLADGSLVYAEFRLGTARLGVADEDPQWNRSPRSLGGSAVPIDLVVEDADAFIDRAVAAGAEVVIPVADRSHGRAGRLADPFGHLWIISAPLAPERHWLPTEAFDHETGLGDNPRQ
jgi:PhnB protein